MSCVASDSPKQRLHESNQAFVCVNTAMVANATCGLLPYRALRKKKKAVLVDFVKRCGNNDGITQITGSLVIKASLNWI